MSTTNVNPTSGAIDLAGFTKQAILLVREAEEMGWTFRRTTHGANGRAPDGTSTISVSRKLGNSHGRAFQTTQATLRRWQRKHADNARVSQEEKDRVLSGASVISQHPWKTSDRVTSRQWSNGTTDYGCTFDGCTYSSKNPRSVSQHYGAAHTYPAVHGKPLSTPSMRKRDFKRAMDPVDGALAIAAMSTPIPVTITVDDTGKIEEVQLGHHLTGGSEPVAEPIAEVVAGPTAESEPVPEPARVVVPEAAEMVDKIREIVAAPLIAELERQVAANQTLLDRLTAMESERDALAAKLTRRDRDLGALRGLIDELSADE